MNEKEHLPVGSCAPPKSNDISREYGGSPFYDWNFVLADQAVSSCWTGPSPDDKRESQQKATLAALRGMAPKDELEGMMAAQLVAAHNAIMECYRRASLSTQSFEGRREALNQAAKLSRAYTATINTLNKYRGKGQQKVTVEHVHVHAGGQAIVGSVNQNGGGRNKMEEQPHAQQITYAFEPAVWGEDASEDALPIPRDGEWSLPDAWREIKGSADR